MEELRRPHQNGVPLQVHQPIPQLMMDLGPPLFQLTGLAIGNGLTDPQLQVNIFFNTRGASAGYEDSSSVGS